MWELVRVNLVFKVLNHKAKQWTVARILVPEVVATDWAEVAVGENRVFIH